MDQPRGIRTACDFCHNKRIKCRREKGASKCFQCTARGQDCKFSPKEKTGPKPKQRERGPNSNRNSNSLSPQNNSSKGIYHRKLSVNETTNWCYSPGDDYREDSDVDILTAQVSPLPEFLQPQGNPQCLPVVDGEVLVSPQHGFPERTPEVQVLEDKYLDAYLSTISQLLPFCEKSVLLQASALRRGRANLSNVESPLSQAFLSAAIAIGALMFNDPLSEIYHQESRAQLKRVFTGTHPEAAGILSMLGFYWLCRGENAKKNMYLQHAKLGLSNSTVPTNIQLIMDHLDYDDRTILRPDARSMSARYRVLHAVSCLLCDMSRLMSPILGSVFAQAYCQELYDCSVGLEEEATESCQLELPRLLCYSLRAFLLLLLGERNETISTLAKIPSLLQSNPNIAKALPLSWDTAIIAGCLAFILGMKAEYQVIFNVVDAERNTCIASSWMCRLPEPQSSLEAFLGHQCRSSSNICSIICHIGVTTKCGTVTYYDPGAHTNMGMQDSFLSAPPLPENHEDLDPKESNVEPMNNSNGQPLLHSKGIHGSLDDVPGISRMDMSHSIGASIGQSIGDMKNIFNCDDSLSEQMLGFALQQTDGVDDGKGNTQMPDAADDRNRFSYLKNMSFGSFPGSRNLTGISDSVVNILDDAEFDHAFDEWTGESSPTVQDYNSSYESAQDQSGHCLDTMIKAGQKSPNI